MVIAIGHESPFIGTVRVYEGRQNAVLWIAGFKEWITEFRLWMLALLYISAAERKQNDQRQPGKERVYLSGSTIKGHQGSHPKQEPKQSWREMLLIDFLPLACSAFSNNPDSPA